MNHKHTHTHKMKKTTPRNIIITLFKTSDKRTKKPKTEKRAPDMQRNQVRMTADFALETMKARGQWGSVFKVLTTTPT